MAFTYNGEIDSSDLDWIRFTVGDTIETGARLSDAEITALLNLYNDKYHAAKYAMEKILSMLAVKTSHKIGSTTVEAGKMYDNYQKRYDKYIQEMDKTVTAVPGISPQEALNPSIFTIGMMDATKYNCN